MDVFMVCVPAYACVHPFLWILCAYPEDNIWADVCLPHVCLLLRCCIFSHIYLDKTRLMDAEKETVAGWSIAAVLLNLSNRLLFVPSVIVVQTLWDRLMSYNHKDREELHAKKQEKSIWIRLTWTLTSPDTVLSYKCFVGASAAAADQNHPLCCIVSENSDRIDHLQFWNVITVFYPQFGQSWGKQENYVVHITK